MNTTTNTADTPKREYLPLLPLEVPDGVQPGIRGGSEPLLTSSDQENLEYDEIEIKHGHRACGDTDRATGKISAIQLRTFVAWCRRRLGFGRDGRC